VIDKADGKRYIISLDTPAEPHKLEANFTFDWGPGAEDTAALALARYIIQHTTGSRTLTEVLSAVFAKEIVQQHFKAEKMWVLPTTDVLDWVKQKTGSWVGERVN
jgi:hypothetical protein